MEASGMYHKKRKGAGGMYTGKKEQNEGGGNTAMDSVRTAKRLGADRAMIVYRRRYI